MGSALDRVHGDHEVGHLAVATPVTTLWHVLCFVQVAGGAPMSLQRVLLALTIALFILAVIAHVAGWTTWPCFGCLP